MNKIITIDCDNVLSDTCHAFIQYYKQKYGEHVAYEDVTHAYIHMNAVFSKFPHDDSMSSYIEFFEFVHQQASIHPMKGAQSAVQALKLMGYNLHVVTARIDAQQKTTAKRLDTYFPDMFEEVHYTNDSTGKSLPKGVMCKQIGSILHLDDFYHYAESIAQEQILTLLFDAPRNRYGSDKEFIKRVYGWDDVCKVLQ